MRYVVLLLILLGSCRAPKEFPVASTKGDRRSLVFGRVSFTDPTKKVTTLSLQRKYRPYLLRGEKVHVFSDGFFFAENMIPGDYRVDAVYDEDRGYILPEQSIKEVKVERSVVQYLGSYEVKALKNNTDPRGVLAKALPEEERALLERVLREVKGTDWEKMVVKRIESLSSASGPASQSQPSSQPR